MVDAADAWNLEQPTYAAIQGGELASARQYRAAVYSMFAAGKYARAEVAGAVGKSDRTARDYDKIAGIDVYQNVRRVELQNANDLPDRRTDFSARAWLESTERKRRYPPTRSGYERARAASVDHDRRAVVYLCIQQANTYYTPERADRPYGLPVEVRRELVRLNQTALARVYEALIMGGKRPGDVFTASEAVEICARYGIPESTVGAALKAAPEWLQQPAGAPETPADVQTPTGAQSAPQQGAEGANGAQSAADPLVSMLQDMGGEMRGGDHAGI